MKYFVIHQESDGRYHTDNSCDGEACFDSFDLAKSHAVRLARMSNYSYYVVYAVGVASRPPSDVTWNIIASWLKD